MDECKPLEEGTRVLFLTEGVLLRQLAADPALSEFNVLIIDEAHERQEFTLVPISAQLELTLPLSA